ncbi:MAG: hypothetical protein ACRDHW_00330 [Ktedonobacteraceae bacterium]
MATTLEQLAQRVAYLERELKRHGVLLDHQQAETDTRLADIQQHLNQQDVTQQAGNQQIAALAQQVSGLAQDVKDGFTGMGKRLDWQDGQIADLNANITEVRNTVADLVQREGKK